MNTKNREYILSFMDGTASFINEVKISDNVTFEKRDKYLYCYNAIMGHTGVSQYYDHELGGTTNKVVKIHKFDTDLLNDDSIGTIVGKPITLMHPRDENGKVLFVDGTNFRKFEIGTVLEAWRKDNSILGNLVIKDQETIANILSGKLKSLSLGYNAKLVKIGDNEYKQDDFYFNHLALVPKGRMINAGIIDHDSLEEVNEKMSLWQKIKNAFSKDEVKFEDNDVIAVQDFVDEKHITKRFRVVEETNIYDDETGESIGHYKVDEKTINTTETALKDKNKNGVPLPVIGDEEQVVDENNGDKVKTDNEEKTDDETVNVADENQTTQTNDESTSGENPDNQENKNNENGKDFGDEVMNEEMKKALIAEITQSIMNEVKTNKDAFADIDPLKQQDPTPTKYQLNFARDEQLRKEAWDLATNPVRHYGDFAELEKARKKILG